MLIPKQGSHCHACNCLAHGFHPLSKMSHLIRLQIMIFLFLIKERKEEYGQKTYQWHVKYTSKKRNITPLSLELDNFYKKLSESGKLSCYHLSLPTVKPMCLYTSWEYCKKPLSHLLRKNIWLSWSFITVRVWIMLRWINNHSKTVRSCWKENNAADWFKSVF